MLLKHRFVLPKPLLSFSQRTHPIHSIRPNTHVWVCFAPFHYYVYIVVENGSHMCYNSTDLCCRNNCGVFRNERMQSTPLDAKLMFGCVSHHFVTMTIQLCITGPTCTIKAPVCVAETTVEFFATDKSNPLH